MWLGLGTFVGMQCPLKHEISNIIISDKYPIISDFVLLLDDILSIILISMIDVGGVLCKVFDLDSL